MQVAFANNGLDSYRQGNYVQAANQLVNTTDKDPVVDYYLARMRLYGYGQLKNNALAMRYFKQAAEKGYLPAQHIMGSYALLQDKNPEQAFAWFKKAAEANDIQAQMFCAAAYLYGVGVKKNSETAKRYYIAAAKNGDSVAQYTLADDFINSRQAANKKLGMLWLNKSVAQGNPQAQLKLGELYASGTLLEHNIAKAKELIGLAVAQDYLPAIYQMGEIARQDNNLVVAMDWYKKAALKKYSPAQVALAQLYLQTKSPLYEPKTGFLWLLKAAENGSSEAQLALATLYKEGQVIARDQNLAVEWQQRGLETAKDSAVIAEIKAAQWLSSDKASSFAASGFQLPGIFSAWSNPKALQENNYNQAPQMDVVTRDELYKPHFTMATPNKIAISEYYDVLVSSLGPLLQSQIDFPVYPMDPHYTALEQDEFASKFIAKMDEQETLTAADDSSDFDILAFLTPVEEAAPRQQSIVAQLHGQAILGDPSAQFTLGQMYQAGINVNKNVQEAIKYYEMAAEQEDLRAEYALGILFLEGRELPPQYRKAQGWLRDAAFKGNEYAQYALGRIKENGYRNAAGVLVIIPKPEQSLAMYYLASDNNYGPAQFRLAETLVRQKQTDISTAAKEKRNGLIKQLYEGAVLEGVAQAGLPLAFFNAMDSDPAKQARAFEVAKKEAGKGDGKAALLLGIMFDRGIAVAANQVEALYWYHQASVNPVSTFILGTYFSEGIGVSKDIEKGKSLLQQSANAGFSYANLNLAVMKQQDGQAFLPELDTALALGNSTAGLLLADYYLSIASDADKMKQAFDIYQHFAEKGDKESQLKLAFMYEQGLGVSVDVLNAQKWYTMAANQGEPIAQFALGHLNQLGLLTPQPDYAEAKKWYSSAQANYAPAAVALGFIYDTVDDDYKQALVGYQKATQLGDAKGQFNLGLIYEKGKGQPVDFEKAKDLYLQAAAQGHEQAMVQLAGLYFNGLAGPRDQQQALHWYKKAADLSDRDALYQLGLLSETGVATKLDFSDAINYYQKSAEKGNAKAMLALARMYQYGLGVKKNNQQAAKFYKELAAMNNPYAQYQLATFYYEGSAGERSPEQGRRLLQLAQDNGSLQARKVLQWLDSQSQARSSFIEPILLNQVPVVADKAADLMYLDALNEWNRGDELLSRMILDRILMEFPHYIPAKRAYEQLHIELTPKIFG